VLVVSSTQTGNAAQETCPTEEMWSGFYREVERFSSRVQEFIVDGSHHIT
jgi:hypothetical protein